MAAPWLSGGLGARAPDATNDPRRDRDDARAHAEAAIRHSCLARLDDYAAVLRTRGTTARHQADELRHVRLALDAADAGRLSPTQITGALIEAMIATAPANSRSARFGAVSRFLAWSLRGSGHVAPALLFDRHERPKPPASRRRVLTGEEIAALWRATEALANPSVRDLVRFLGSTPCRRGEAAAMRWADLDLETRVWHQPTSKNGDPHDFPLNARALAILLSRRNAAGATRAAAVALVFPGPRHGRPFAGWSNATKAMARAVPVADWRLHDLRRSFVTALAESGYDETLLDLTINHRASRSRSGVRGFYQRSVRWPERVSALDSWSGLLDRLLDGPLSNSEST